MASRKTVITSMKSCRR